MVIVLYISLLMRNFEEKPEKQQQKRKIKEKTNGDVSLYLYLWRSVADKIIPIVKTC